MGASNQQVWQSASTQTGVASRVHASTVERRFYAGFAPTVALAEVVVFARSFYLKPVLFHDFPAPPEPLFIVHGIVFSAMLPLGTLQMATPGTARWPALAPFGPPAFFGIADLLLVALAIFDVRTRGRLHPVTLRGGIATIVAQPLQLIISGTDAWLGFARWATTVRGLAPY